MDRRTFLVVTLAAPLAAGNAPPVDALLVGDSLAFQLGPRLRRAAASRGRTVAYEGRGGTSARQWREKGWLRDAVRRHPSASVLICLGTNCTPGERPRLADDVRALVRKVPQGRGVLWLFPPPLRYSTDYIGKAVEAAGLRSFSPGPLPMEWDGRLRRPDVHPTDAGHVRWAGMLVDHLWPSEE